MRYRASGRVMMRHKYYAGWVMLAGLFAGTGVAEAEDGCEYVVVVDFFEQVVSHNSQCFWSDERNVYECSKPGGPSWDLSVSIQAPNNGRGTAVRDDGFTVIFSCACTRECGFEDPSGNVTKGGES